MRRRHYTIDDNEPHGTVELTQYLTKDLPDTGRRLYGRRMIRRLIRDCPRCRTADQARGRLRRLHSGYRR